MLPRRMRRQFGTVGTRSSSGRRPMPGEDDRVVEDVEIAAFVFAVMSSALGRWFHGRACGGSGCRTGRTWWGRLEGAYIGGCV